MTRLLIAISMTQICILACSSRSYTVETVHPKVQELWLRHERALERILDGNRFDLPPFVAAIEFFEDLTSIPSRDSKTHFGRLPNSHLAEDLSRWKQWYAENAQALRWNPVTRSISVEPDTGCHDTELSSPQG